MDCDSAVTNSILCISHQWQSDVVSIIADLKITYSQKARDVYLDEDEVIAFLEAMKDDSPTNRMGRTTLDMIKFYLLTGIRRSEIYKAEVNDDFIFIPDTNNGKDLYIPRNQYVDKYLYLFEKDLPGNIRRTLTSLSKSVFQDIENNILEYKNITPHVLRHTFISLCAYLEIAPSVIQRCVNHSSRSITENVYTHRKFDTQVDKAFKAVGHYLEAEL